jgi:hypothetical protein
MPAIPASGCSGACAIQCRERLAAPYRYRGTFSRRHGQRLRSGSRRAAICHVFRGYKGAELARVNPEYSSSVTCPFTGEQLAAVPGYCRPDVTFIHAQKADRKGNVLIEGIVGVQKEAVLAAQVARSSQSRRVVDDLAAHPNACVLPGWTVGAICRRARRRPSFLRPRILPARQCQLHRLGQHRRGSR